jgi:hypothetical protein
MMEVCIQVLKMTCDENEMKLEDIEKPTISRITSTWDTVDEIYICRLKLHITCDWARLGLF